MDVKNAESQLSASKTADQGLQHSIGVGYSPLDVERSCASHTSHSVQLHFPQRTTPCQMTGSNMPDVFIYEPDKEIVSLEGYHAPWWKQLLYFLIGAVTAGLSFLVCKWSPRLHIILSLSPCALKDAQHVLIRLADGRVDLERVHEVAMVEPLYDSHPVLSSDEDGGGVGQGQCASPQIQKVHRLLEYRCTRYFYTEGGPAVTGGGSPTGPMFTPVPAVPKGFIEQLRTAAQTLAATGSTVDVERLWDPKLRQHRYGKNVMVIPVKNIFALVFNEMWHPFYVFQYFSIIIWLVEEYYVYSVCIAVITWFSIIITSVEAHRNMKRLAAVAWFECEVDVLRSGEVARLTSSVLVPGDLVVVGPGALPCDMVLLRGECIVDEHLLTGESVPVRKVPYNPVSDGLSYEPEKCPGCTLFGGTMVAQARAPRNQKAVAMVCRTSFYSAKGQLLRSILFPRELEKSLVSDALKFILMMLVFCMGIFVWAAVAMSRVGASSESIGFRFLDMITVAVPPALPACLIIATLCSISRLRKKGIYVTGPDRITLAGQLDIICFDKTGTLTDQGLELQGIVPVVGNQLHDMVCNVSLLPAQLLELLASCHGLARMGEALVGDPLDQKLFLATNWDLIDEVPSMDGNPSSGDPIKLRSNSGDLPGMQNDDPKANEALEAAEAGGMSDCVRTFIRPPGASKLAFSIIKRFEFSAALQRNLVVVRAPDGSVSVFTKGSPEAIRSLVDPTSVPADFDKLLGELTREGLRVLALAAGDASGIPETTLLGWKQSETEAGVGLRLVGLAVMANTLRQDTLGVIQELQRASIRTVMVTGDHLLTAVSVANKCAILPVQRSILLVDAADTASPPEATLTMPVALNVKAETSSPTLSPAAAPYASAIAPGPVGLCLSVLDTDGNVTETASFGSLGTGSTAVSQLMSQLVMGELECGVTGKGFNCLLTSPHLQPQSQSGSLPLLLPVLQRAAVFARMSPDNKRDLMLLLGRGIDGTPEGCPHLGLRVGFCGDGANDCGALKAAHVGVSLCEAEASVAAPMTSKAQTIASMLTVVAEGRCALMATYQIFQFIIAYALVQAFEVNLMYTFALDLGDYKYLIEDLFFVTVLAALMGWTSPRSKLSRRRPLPHVMSLPLMMSTMAQCVVVVIFQLASLWMLQAQPGYTKYIGDSELEDTVAPENTVTYIVALAQYVVLALVFNKGMPHRSPIWTNRWLVAALVAQTGFVMYTLFAWDKFNEVVQELVDLTDSLSMTFRWKLFGLLMGMGCAALLAECTARGLVRLVDWALARKVKASMGE